MKFIMTGMVRLYDEQGRLALLVSSSGAGHDRQRIFVPPGGVLVYKEQGRSRLEAMGATDFDGDRVIPPVVELHFRAPEKQMDDIVGWFRERSGRETTVARVFAQGVVGRRLLSYGDLEGLAESFSKYRKLPIRNVSGEATLYLAEVFNLILPAPPGAFE